MRSLMASMVLGVNPGYFHDNNNPLTLEEFSQIIFDVMQDYSNNTGEYVAFNITKVKITYKYEWGCPVGGEDAFKLEATLNPAYDEKDEWIERVNKIAKYLKTYFGQSTVTLAFVEIPQLIYMAD